MRNFYRPLMMYARIPPYRKLWNMFTKRLRAFEVRVCSWKEDLCHIEQKICSWTECCVPWCLQVARAQLCWWHMEGGLRAKHSQKRVTQEHRNCQDTLGNTLEHMVGISKHREDGNRGKGDITIFTRTLCFFYFFLQLVANVTIITT